MSRKTRTDYNDIFDNALDDMSDLVHAFTKKNKRVHRIFNDDDDEVQTNEKSYGLRLVSVHENDATLTKATSDKENGRQEPKRSITNIPPLSPVAIIEAPPEQILEARSPFKHPSQLSSRQNASLRRSLFQQLPKNINNDIICSTPSTRNQGTINDFFGASSISRIDGLSPIKKGLSNTIITVEDLNNIELIQPENNKKSQNGVAVPSLHNYEKDLREQFHIDQQTPKKSYSKSLAGDISRRAISEIKDPQSPSRRSMRSEPISRSQPPQDCSMVLEPMEISKETVSMYRKAQLSRLSTSNRTNVNTFNMIETPIARQTKHSVINDSLLAKKLALCDSDSELTDDESEKGEQSRKSATQNQAQKHKTDENLTNDESDKAVESSKRCKISQSINPTPKKAPSRRPSRQSAQIRQNPVDLQNNITNDESDQENHQFELVEINKSRQQVDNTPKKAPSRRPSLSQKSKRIDEEAQKYRASNNGNREDHNNSSDDSDNDRHTKTDKNRRKHSQQMDINPKKIPSRRPSKDVRAENHKSKKKEQEPQKVATSKQKSKKSVRETQNNTSNESENERPTKKDKTHKKNVPEPKKKVSEKKESVHTTEASENMARSESETENNEKERASTKTSKQMSISDNRKGRKSTKSTKQMSMSGSESEYESTQQDSQKSTRNSEKMRMSGSESEYESTTQDSQKSTRGSEQMSMSEEESEQLVDPIENRKSKGTKKRPQSPVADLTDQGSSENDNIQESQESEEEAPPKVQKAAKKNGKKSQKAIKKDASEREGSESECSDAPPITKTKPSMKSKKPAASTKPNQQKNKKTAKNKEPESENSENDEEPRSQAENELFKKPGNFKKPIRDTILCNLSNVSATSLVPTEIIESFCTLQKPGNNTTSTARESSKVSVPKRTKPRKENPNKKKITEYFCLEKNVKHKKSKNDPKKGRKRTLYHQSEDDEETAKVTNNNPIDHELSEEVSAIRRSIDTMSDASSQPFNAEIPSPQKGKDNDPKKKGKNAGRNKIEDESYQEMEVVQQAPKRRGRPRKNKEQENEGNKEQGKKQQVAEESEDNSRQMSQQVPKKTKKMKELKELTRRPASKRQNNSKDDTEPPSKTRRRATSNSSEESTSETSKNTDEGFQSNEEYDDVWYDPMERGCQRTGLRVRKFTKSRDGRFAIQYGVFTREDSKAVQLQRKYNIKESEVHNPSLAPFIQPGNRLEVVKSLIMEKKLQKKNGPPQKKEVKAKTQKTSEKVNDGASTSRQAMDTDSMASFATALTNETQSGVISRLLDSFNRLNDDDSNPINLMETATYAISQINRLIWHPIGDGVFYSSFKENSFDGFLKIVKGGYKKGAKTKLAVVKMTLLCGVVDIKVNDSKLRIENLGFITITRGQSYRIMNASDETAIILMTRLDDEERTYLNQHSSST